MSFLSFCSLVNPGVVGVVDEGVEDSSDMVVVGYKNSFILASIKST